ncbi:uncharacterized protein V6R79_022191 [Siganus canaliculatus]
MDGCLAAACCHWTPHYLPGSRRGQQAEHRSCQDLRLLLLPSRIPVSRHDPWSRPAALAVTSEQTLGAVNPAECG